MSFPYSEDLLQFIWEFQLYNQDGLKTTEGDSIQIIKQGLLNTNSGPDFENSVVKIGNQAFYGSIEIHKNTAEWNSHKHHEDVAYNNVILHVCLEGSNHCLRQDGTVLKTLLLSNRINEKALKSYEMLMLEKPFVACEGSVNQISGFDISSWLDRVGIEKLEARSESIKTYLNLFEGNWNQAFFITLCRSFGMPINSDAFEELGMKLPFEILQKHQNSLFQIESLLFGTMGLLSADKQDTYYSGLRSEYQFLKEKYKLKTVTTKIKMGRMRPMNLPHVKLSQLAALIHHVPHFVSHILQLPPTDEIKNLLSFETSKYWETHYSFERESINKKKKISKGFVNHLFLNALVPFVFFYQKMKNHENQDVALSYLESIPAESNSIINKWGDLEVKAENALISQALLNLYKTYCKPKRCLECHIGRKIILK